MDIYHVWCNLKPGVKDTEFVADAARYFDYLKSQSKLSHYRIMRKKLGFGPPESLEFHIMLEFENMAHFDEAFNQVATREGDVEQFHFAVNSKVSAVKFALYRDFPDPVRITGKELF